MFFLAPRPSMVDFLPSWRKNRSEEHIKISRKNNKTEVVSGKKSQKDKMQILKRS